VVLTDPTSALVIDDSLSLVERVQRYIGSEHDLHRLFTTKLLGDAAEVRPSPPLHPPGASRTS
jgi:hypothetical protein